MSDNRRILFAINPSEHPIGVWDIRTTDPKFLKVELDSWQRRKLVASALSIFPNFATVMAVMKPILAGQADNIPLCFWNIVSGTRLEITLGTGDIPVWLGGDQSESWSSVKIEGTNEVYISGIKRGTSTREFIFTSAKLELALQLNAGGEVIGCAQNKAFVKEVQIRTLRLPMVM